MRLKNQSPGLHAGCPERLETLVLEKFLDLQPQPVVIIDNEN
jgi:hypothetical protein